MSGSCFRSDFRNCFNCFLMLLIVLFSRGFHVFVQKSLQTTLDIKPIAKMKVEVVDKSLNTPLSSQYY